MTELAVRQGENGEFFFVAAVLYHSVPSLSIPFRYFFKPGLCFCRSRPSYRDGRREIIINILRPGTPPRLSMPGADKADKPEKLILNCKTEAAGEVFPTHAVEVCLNFIDGRSRAV